MHFINGFNQLFGNEQDEIIKEKYKEIKTFLQSKKEGDIDSQDVRTIKGLIRRGEARTASTFNQIPLDHVHFLDLPFYESGKIEKLPMGEADVNIVRNLISTIQPHQIYVAGDLAIHMVLIASVQMLFSQHSTWRKKQKQSGLKTVEYGCIVAHGLNGRLKTLRCAYQSVLRNFVQSVTLSLNTKAKWRVHHPWE